MYKLLFKKDDAIDFYMRIVADAITAMGESSIHVEEYNQLNHQDKIVTVLARDFAKLWRRRRIHPIINWFQGIAPEETKLGLQSNGFKLKKALFRFLVTENEKFVLNKSLLNIFVSETMREHYEKKYGYNKNNYFIMPCFNQFIHAPAFTDKKYSKPTFVYTGNLSSWQCFEPMLNLFKRIKDNIPDAELTIYTRDQEKARILLTKYGIEAAVKYVPYMQLNEEIKDYKYGFIIREDIEVNRVATPTKMSSYLANGIIPVYSDVVGAFKESISCMHYSIPLAPITNSGIEKLFALEKTEIKGEDVFYEYKKLFDSYYNREKYVKELSQKLSDLNKGVV